MKSKLSCNLLILCLVKVFKKLKKFLKFMVKNEICRSSGRIIELVNSMKESHKVFLLTFGLREGCELQIVLAHLRLQPGSSKDFIEKLTRPPLDPSLSEN